MDPVSLIVAALVQGLLAGLQSSSEQLVVDSYHGLKDAIVRRYGAKARESLAQLEADPRSKARQAMVEADLRSWGAGEDPVLQRMADALRAIVENPMARQQDDAPSSSDFVDPIERAQRRAGAQVIGQVMDKHVAAVRELRARYMVDDTELLSSNVSHSANVPSAIRDEIAGLHTRIRAVIEQIALRIEEGKYRDAEQAIAEMPLAYSERKRAFDIVQADKRMHISYQALKITIEFFSGLNQSILQKIERNDVPEREANMMLGNAIMIYELTDFVINYIQHFVIDGADDIERLHQEARRKVADLRHQQQLLEQRASAPGIEPAVREQTLEDVRNRAAALDELDREWDKYVSDVKQLHATVGEVHGKLQTLELIRENARVQISLLQIIAMLRFLKRNSDAIQGTVDALKGFRLAPLSPYRVRRLLGIA